MKFRTALALGAASLLLTGCTITIGQPQTQRSAAPAPTVTPSRAATSPSDGASATAGDGTISASPSANQQPSEANWSELVAQDGAAVVRLQVSSCDSDASMGSGFVLGDHLVMTAAHMVQNADTISVKSDQGITSARTIAYDLSTDSALLYTQGSLGGHHLKLSHSRPQYGADLAVLGYPLGVTDLRITTGIVSGVDTSVDYGTFAVDHVFVTDAATNGGNSGGPVIDRTGAVIGLVSGGQAWSSNGTDLRPVQNTNYVVPARALSARFADWRRESAPAAASCGDYQAPVGGDFSLDVSIESGHPNADDAGQVLYLHGTAINTGDYPAAWNLFTARLQRELGDFQGWQAGLATSYWDSLDVRRVSGDPDRLTATVTLRTRQDAEYGGPDRQTCTDWDMRYRMKRTDGVLLIDHVDARTRTAC